MENNDEEIQIDVKKICRTCMQEGQMTDLYYNCDKNCCLLEKLMHCTFLQVLPNDGLPSQICSDCLTQINSAYTFAKKCEEVDKLLRDCYHFDKKIKHVNIPPKTVKTEMKTEVKVEVLLDKVEIIDEVNSDDNYEINFDPSNYTDHTYDKKSSELIITHETTAKQEINEQHVLKTKDTFDKKTARARIKPGPPYVCKRCDESFPVYHQLKEHIKVAQHTRKDYSHRACPICSKVVSYSHLNHHLRTHTKEKPYCCEICGRRFSLGGNLIRHRRIHTGDKPYKCDICGRRFNQSTRMKDHRRLHTGEKAYVCNICGKAFTQFANFRSHMKKHEKEGEEENGTSTIDSDGATRPRKTKDSAAANLKCDICNQSFRFARSLKTHLMTHEEKKFNCSDCGRGFTDMQRLQNHFKSHTAVRPYSCHICQKGFLLKSGLKNHLFIHSGEKPYQCNYCERAFAQLGQLKYHLRIHTGEKPYPCSVCGKAFALNGNLTVHMRTHTGETPHICFVCNKGFYDSSTLKKHLKSHV